MGVVTLNYLILVPAGYKCKNSLTPGYSSVYITLEDLTYVDLIRTSRKLWHEAENRNWVNFGLH